MDPREATVTPDMALDVVFLHSLEIMKYKGREGQPPNSQIKSH